MNTQNPHQVNMNNPDLQHPGDLKYNQLAYADVDEDDDFWGGGGGGGMGYDSDSSDGNGGDGGNGGGTESEAVHDPMADFAW